MTARYHRVPNFTRILHTTKVIVMVLSGIVCLVSLSWWLWLYWGFVLSYQQEVHGLFPLNSSVIDIKDGSMRELLNIVRNKPINMVIFYAPWSGDSIASVKELSAASQFLTSPTVAFISINCWEGSCKNVFTTYYFPRIFLYHTSNTPIEYLFDIDFYNIISFIQSAVRPWIYIGNKQQLTNFLNTDNYVISYMDKKFIQNGNRYQTFLSASVRLINRANKPKIGLIIDSELAVYAKLTAHGQICSSGFLRKMKCYPLSGTYFVDDIIHWISVHIKEIVSELTPNATDASYYLNSLKKTPVALLAYSNNTLHHQFQHAALTYYNCTCPIIENNIHKQKCLFSRKQDRCITSWNLGIVCTHCQFCYGVCECSSFMSKSHIPLLQSSGNCLSSRISTYYFQDSYSVCCFKISSKGTLKKWIPSGHFIDKVKNLNLKQTWFKIHLKTFFFNKKQAVPKSSNKLQRCGLSAACCNTKDGQLPHKSFEGLACKTNRTLSFYTMNYNKYKFILNSVGVADAPSLLIFDVLSEESFVSRNLTYKVIVDSIMNFTNGYLQQHFESLNTEKEKDDQSGKVTELTSSSFEDFILKTTKNVFVMFYAAWCGICKAVNFQFLLLAHTYKRSDVVFARINGDKNPLPWHYMPSHYPSFILFPQYKKADSIHFDDDLDFSLQSFVTFLDKYLK